jgi:hypothetical protein
MIKALSKDPRRNANKIYQNKKIHLLLLIKRVNSLGLENIVASLWSEKKTLCEDPSTQSVC